MKFVKTIKFLAVCVLVCLLTEVLPATAQMCLKSDCAALGYNNTATACQNHFDILKCPFNTAKAVCGGEVKMAGTGVNMFYYEGKLYSAINGNMGGVYYSSADNGCTAKGYRLPTSGEAYRISALRSLLTISVSINTHGSSVSSGLWTNATCSDGHMVAYLDGPKCKSDATAMNGSVCVKEL